MTGKSPYEKNYKYHVTACERNLINKRQVVTKLNRKELEDKYLTLCDENYFLKCQNTKKEEKIKFLLAKIIRINENKTNLRASSASVLSVMTSSDCGSNYELEIKGIKNNMSLGRQKSGRIKGSRSIKDLKDNVSNINIDENSQSKNSSSENSPKRNLIQSQTTSNKLEELKETLSVQLNENSKLTERNEYLEQQLSQINLKKYIMENVEINRYKVKVVELRQALNKLQEKIIKLSSQKNTKIVVQQKEINELMLKLKNEKEKNIELSEKLEFTKSNQRQIEMMKQQIDELKYDKKSLIEQQDHLASIIKTTALRDSLTTTTTSDTTSECCDCDSAIQQHHNCQDELKDTLMKLKTENAAIKSSQDEMFKKLCYLQDLNDEVTIELERYRPNCLNLDNI